MLELRRMVVYTQYERPVVFEHMKKTSLFTDEIICPMCKEHIKDGGNMLMARCTENRFPITYIHKECVDNISDGEPTRSDWHHICLHLENGWEAARKALKQWKCWLPTITV